MKRLIAATVIALAVLAIGAGLVERHWRARGYAPGIIDSKDLWSAERARLDRTGGTRALALIGASRTLYSVDLDVLRTRLPGYEPVMLALDAAPARATLRDLAADEAFDGTVLVDVDALGLWQPTWAL
jgi:hypothetical protein